MKKFIMSILCLLLPGCYNNSIDYYGSKTDKVDLRSFFNGDIEGSGALFDYQGRQARSFTVKIKGKFKGNDGTLQEWFVFDDGEKTERTWNVTFSNNQLFIASAKDVIKTAQGVQNGNAINMHYTLAVPYKKSTLNVNMDDWMYLIDHNTILNRTSMKKFGFKVGEIVLFMKKTS